jgi:predicted oxidoreductase
MNDEVIEKLMLHQLNQQAGELNQNIVQKSSALNDIPIDNKLYESSQPQPQPQQFQQQIPQPVQQPVQQVVQPQVQTVVQQDLNPLIERVTSLEKQVTKFITLIERNVAKNAKEINIRIKLNENNGSTNKK